MNERSVTPNEARANFPGWTQPDYVAEPLYVVTPVFNPLRYKSRWKLYQRFAHMVEAAGAVLVTVEAAFGERAHAVAKDARHREVHAAPEMSGWAAEHRYYKVQSTSELWLKENLINYTVARLPDDWKYVAWIDCDVAFARPNWVSETIHQLQHFSVVQMFSEACDLRPDYTALNHRPSFAAVYNSGGDIDPRATGGEYYGEGKKGVGPGFSTGYAWAARRDAWDHLGGLVDFCVGGSADWHMAFALVGALERSIPVRLSGGYRAGLEEWERRAERHVRRNLGVVTGLLQHHWHGKKVNRHYKSRWSILTDYAFDPNRDLKRDWQGVWQLVDRGSERSIKLRDALRGYFRARNEDDISVE